ncbi:MAG TPA: class I SAM-dependent methyltransferase [Candidatus Paceibacterota bacterium]|nr:class I SAM-dependent methyltransferase [Candidatus Paceibacterota bacterium]
MDITRDTYNRIAKDWHADHQDDDWWIEGTEKFVSFLKLHDPVLDAGCGGGTKSKHLINKGLDVTGIDFSESMIAVAKENVPQGKFFVADIRDLSGFPGLFSGILLQAVLLHIPKKECLSVLRQLKNKLKPGGFLYVAVKELRSGNPEEEIVTENDYGYSYDRFFSYFTLEDFQKYFKELDMKILYEKVVQAGKTRWIQVIAR